MKGARVMANTSYLEDRIADYHDAETLSVFWLTTPEAVAELLPPPLEPLEAPLAVAFLARYPEVSFGTPYMAGALVLMCRYQGEFGSYILSMPEDDDYPVFLGREILGFPKKMGVLGLTREGTTMHGIVDRRGVRLCEIEATLDGEPNDPEAIEILSQFYEMPEEGATTLPANDLVTFLFKYQYGAAVENTFEDPVRLVRQVTVSRAHSMEAGSMSVVLQGSPSDSCWGRVPVVRPLGALYTVSHNTMQPGEVVADVDFASFEPYAALKYES
jgi:acetoacetate decarboxylase